MNIQAQLEDLSSVKKRLKIEIPAEAVDDEFNQVCRQFKARVRLAGFRPGRAPLHLVKRHFGNEIREEVVRRLLPPSYRQALKQYDLNPLGDPQWHQTNFQQGEPLRFDADFEILPEIVLGDYKNLEVAPVVEEVTPEMVDRQLEELRKNNARLEPVEGRPARSGDLALVNLQGEYQLAPGEPAPGQISGKSVQIEIDQEQTHPTFSEELAGMSLGDEKTFLVQYDDDYPDEKLAGTDVLFTVELTDLKKKVLPPLNDELARELGEHDTLEALRTGIRNELEEARRKSWDKAVKQALIDKLLENTVFEVPRVLIEARLENKLQDFANNIAARGMDPSRASIDWNLVRSEAEPACEKEVRAELALNQLAWQEGLKVAPEDVDSEIKRIAASLNQNPAKVRQFFEKEGRREGLEAQLMRRRAVDLLVAEASVRD